ncbi:fumarylacetoacetate hydrolase family protein [Alteromonas oceanisediminis]|uniref:fumarylacetoacetate hydrolase family protein n=1 Tax=Alteromonas oceanisediminis TaxID=2836180 RepID=UPI001BDA308B|nr:fumarylacetoacetate hydrolase family protein [Alteromonas oceanisediminis]MBT0587457.1 fumarylacetoacetate hydrolase family protein [Alteromonas oceanisediminis]
MSESVYRHRFRDNRDCHVSAGKIVCVGRNYQAHARELGNDIPQHPLLFMKPQTALADMHQPLHIPAGWGTCHNEIEVAILVGKPLSKADKGSAISAICGVGLGLDLTLRDAQTALKASGHPWERAKAFDRSCPLSVFQPVSLESPQDGQHLQGLQLSLSINGQLRQSGCSRDMIFSILDLLCEISATFTLVPGDVVLTGTPAGVGPLHHEDAIEARLSGALLPEPIVVSTTVIR